MPNKQRQQRPSENMGTLIEKIKGWDLQKKLIAAAVVSLFFILILNIGFVSKGAAANQMAQKDILTKQASINTTQAQIDSILADVEQSLANPNSERSKTYRQQLDDLDRQIGEFYSQLVSTSEMSELLRHLLGEDSNLTLETLQALPTVSVLDELNISEDDLPESDRPKLFKRGTELTFTGGYFNVVDYLKKLEQLHKRLIWGEFNYTVETYPTGKVTLTVYTLSIDKGWIGG